MLRNKKTLHRLFLGSHCFVFGRALARLRFSHHSFLLAADALQPPHIFLMENPVCDHAIHLKCLPQRELWIYSMSFLP